MIEWPRLLAFATSRPGAALALVTLVRRQGSSYRPPGARLLVSTQGDYAGSVSGGCLEDDLARAAQGVLADGAPVLRTVDTRPHYGCHGRLELFIERLPSDLLNQIDTRLRAREPFVLSTRYRSASAVRGTSLHPSAWAEAVSGTDADPEACFEETVGLRPRLLVVGGSADAEPLLHLGALLGWEVRRLVPAGVGAGPDRPARPWEAEVCPAEEVPARFPPDARTAVVIMTHHLARDTHYLRHVLPAPYAYVGLLGSRRRRDTALAALGEEGLLADDSATDRLHAPVGLDLGAADPAAIALSIVAEIQAVWAGRVATPLRQRRAPIHDTPRVALA